MPTCSLSTCKNYSKKTAKPDGVTYHLFPAGQEITKKWIEIVRRNRQDKNWMPNKYSTLCSSHFQNGDIITSKKGLQRVLRRGAFPTKFIINEKKYSTCKHCWQDQEKVEKSNVNIVSDKEEILVRPCKRKCTNTKKQIIELPVDEVAVCTFCKMTIIGCRYTCLECQSVELCVKCERNDLHPDHCVIRIPHPSIITQSVVASMDPLKKALVDYRRSTCSLQKHKAQSLTCEMDNESTMDTNKIEIKYEPDETVTVDEMQLTIDEHTDENFNASTSINKENISIDTAQTSWQNKIIDESAIKMEKDINEPITQESEMNNKIHIKIELDETATIDKNIFSDPFENS